MADFQPIFEKSKIVKKLDFVSFFFVFSFFFSFFFVFFDVFDSQTYFHFFFDVFFDSQTYFHFLRRFFDSQTYFHFFFDCAIAVVTGTIAVVTAKLRSGFAGVVMEAVSARITVARLLGRWQILVKIQNNRIRTSGDLEICLVSLICW